MNEPSYRDPRPLPFRYSAQSVVAKDHSPTMIHRGDEFKLPAVPQIVFNRFWSSYATSALEKTVYWW